MKIGKAGFLALLLVGSTPWLVRARALPPTDASCGGTSCPATILKEERVKRDANSFAHLLPATYSDKSIQSTVPSVADDVLLHPRSPKGGKSSGSPDLTSPNTPDSNDPGAITGIDPLKSDDSGTETDSNDSGAITGIDPLKSDDSGSDTDSNDSGAITGIDPLKSDGSDSGSTDAEPAADPSPSSDQNTLQPDSTSAANPAQTSASPIPTDSTPTNAETTSAVSTSVESATPESSQTVPQCKRANGSDDGNEADASSSGNEAENCSSSSSAPSLDPADINTEDPSGDAGIDAGGFGDDFDTSPEQQAQIDESESDMDYFTEKAEKGLPTKDGEQGNHYINRLTNRIQADTADPVIDKDSMASRYKDGHADNPITDLLSDKLDGHDKFPEMFDELGLDRPQDGESIHLYNSNVNDVAGEIFATQKMSFSFDSKTIFADSSYKAKDNPVPPAVRSKFPEKAVYMLQKYGVDLTKVESIGRVAIENKSTQKTLQAIFDKLPKTGPKNNLVRVKNGSDDPNEKAAFDAIFRTANGRGIYNLLSYYRQAFGDKDVDEVVFRVDGASSLLAKLRPFERQADVPSEADPSLEGDV